MTGAEAEAIAARVVDRCRPTIDRYIGVTAVSENRIFTDVIAQAVVAELKSEVQE